MSYIKPLKSILLIITLFLITSCSNKNNEDTYATYKNY